MNLDAELILILHVQCDKVMEVKAVGNGYLRVIPITGGSFEGRIKGIVVPGGADWNTVFDNQMGHVFAKYLLKTEDNEYIAIENEGKIGINDNDFIKTSPRFQVDSASKYAWLNTGIYVASLEAGKMEGQVEITIYRLK